MYVFLTPYDPSKPSLHMSNAEFGHLKAGWLLFKVLALNTE